MDCYTGKLSRESRKKRETRIVEGMNYAGTEVQVYGAVQRGVCGHVIRGSATTKPFELYICMRKTVLKLGGLSMSLNQQLSSV